MLQRRHINFDKAKQRIRCFPHIVNLACKAILSAITQMDFAAENAQNYEPPLREPNFNPDTADPKLNFLDIIDRDPIASLCSAIRNIRASSIRRQGFSNILNTLGYDNLQLIRDVDTRWSSTYLMIHRALKLMIPIDTYLSQPDTGLEKYELSKSEWEALQKFEKILEIPHAFQQLLSCEKTPTLSYSIPAFQGLISGLSRLKETMPEAAEIIEQGIIKLKDYETQLDAAPANILATLLNPLAKLRFFERKFPETVDRVKSIFHRELLPYFAQSPQSESTTTRQSDTSRAANLLGLDSPVKQRQKKTLQDEITSYFLEPVQGVDDLVAFWQDNQLRWPTLFRLALDILPIQGSAVPCERVFSSGKETTTNRCNRIHHTLMEALQILKFALKNGHTLSFTDGTHKDAEIEYLERDAPNPAPENINDFIQFLNTVSEEVLEVDDDDFDDLYATD